MSRPPDGAARSTGEEAVARASADGRAVAGPTSRAVRALADKLEDLWRARELLVQFVRKELKVRYKNSTLGFLWSLLTPAIMTVVFSVIFTRIAPIDVDDFPAFFISGFLVWQFFQNSCQGSIHSIVGNGDLIKKVYFPREVLPLSHVLAQLVHLLLALLVVSPFLVYARGWGVVTHLPATLLAVALLAVFTSGMAMIFAGANVPFRDLQELIVVIFLVWFYASPVVYPVALVQDATQFEGLFRFAGAVLEANPMTWFVELFRQSFFGDVSAGGDGLVTATPTWPDPRLLTACTAGAVVTFAVGYVFFQRLALTFAKEV